MTRPGFWRVRVILPFIVALLIAIVLPGTGMARPPRLNASSCQQDGYLTLTDQLGTNSPFDSARACARYVKTGGVLYRTPQAWWSQEWEGLFCYAVINVANLDPSASYTVHVVINSLTSAVNPVDQSFTLVFRTDGTAYIGIGYEECGGAPFGAYAEVFDAGGNLLTTAGPTKLFTLS